MRERCSVCQNRELNFKGSPLQRRHRRGGGDSALPATLLAIEVDVPLEVLGQEWRREPAEARKRFLGPGRRDNSDGQHSSDKRSARRSARRASRRCVIKSPGSNQHLPATFRNGRYKQRARGWRSGGTGGRQAVCARVVVQGGGRGGRGEGVTTVLTTGCRRRCPPSRRGRGQSPC